MNRKIRIGAVMVVAVFAAVISFMHIRHLALAHGHDVIAAALLPLIVDGVIVVATTAMTEAAGWWLAWARVLLIGGVGATLAANMAYGAQYGISGMIIWAWPAVAFFGCAELAIGMARHATPAAHDVPVPDAAPDLVPVPDAAPDPDEHARLAWLASRDAGEPMSGRKMAERHGRSRTYWAPRIAAWEAEAA